MVFSVFAKESYFAIFQAMAIFWGSNFRYQIPIFGHILTNLRPENRVFWPQMPKNHHNFPPNALKSHFGAQNSCLGPY